MVLFFFSFGVSVTPGRRLTPPETVTLSVSRVTWNTTCSTSCLGVIDQDPVRKDPTIPRFLPSPGVHRGLTTLTSNIMHPTRQPYPGRVSKPRRRTPDRIRSRKE